MTMKVRIQPSVLKGTIQAPASKSSMQRACAAALVAQGESTIYNPGHSNDDKAALDIIQRLGATLKEEGDAIIVTSKGVKPVAPEINCGESGLSIRMFTPLVALSREEITITGKGSLITRPMNFFDEILPRLQVSIKSNEGKLPMVVQGPLVPGDITVDGSLSSQFLTGLLLAYAASIQETGITGNDTVTITVNDLKSKPYIDLTLDVMQQFGLPIPKHDNHEQFVFTAPATVNENSKRSYTVEGDWSGGAFLLVAGAIAGPITIRGLNPVSTQADKAILQALIDCNSGIAVEAKQIVMHPGTLKAFDFDATDCPDLFPPLVALAAYCEGETTIKGVSRLAHKESDRGITLQEEFAKMGVQIDLKDDIMVIHGGKGLTGAVVHSRHDHRIAMACAVAALKAEGETTVEEADAINKSYPDFYVHLQQLGAMVDTGEKKIKLI
jgi:3-phosphoshikimate 1-carboxyvinyltransferase